MIEGGEIHVGSHRVLTQAPDHVHLLLGGDLSVEDALRIQEEIGAFEQDKEYILLLLDISRLGRLSAEARKAAARAGAMKRCRGIAVYGASFPQRVMPILIVKAFTLLNKNLDSPAAFFDTEAEARAWLSKRRSSLLRGA